MPSIKINCGSLDCSSGAKIFASSLVTVLLSRTSCNGRIAMTCIHDVIDVYTVAVEGDIAVAYLYSLIWHNFKYYCLLQNF